MVIGIFENNRFEDSINGINTDRVLPHVNPPTGYAYLRFQISPTYLKKSEAIKTCDINIFDSEN